MTLLPFCQWLADRSSSIALHESQYAYLLIESAHVLTLCLFVGISVILDLRLLGLTFRSVPASELIHRLMPWMIAGFVTMLVTGALLFYGIPVRSYQSIFFRAKMLMLLVAGLNAWIFHTTIYRRIGEWDLTLPTPRRAKVAGAVSIVLWTCIVIAGRLIAYNWYDCNNQPLSKIVNTLAGCEMESGE
jgi:hypothetical protein